MMQKELDDPEYWKNRSRMKFNSKKYMVVHLGINNNIFFSKSEIHYFIINDGGRKSVSTCHRQLYTIMTVWPWERKMWPYKVSFEVFSENTGRNQWHCTRQNEMSWKTMYAILIKCNQKKTYWNLNRLKKGA